MKTIKLGDPVIVAQDTKEPVLFGGYQDPTIRRGRDGTVLLASGRPGVYLRVSQDASAKEWSDIVPVVEVPKEDYYKKYYEYSCCNTGLVVTGPNTAVIAYSDFTLNAPDGKRAKSIMVRKITVE